jgi:hypothetical protein
MDYVYLRRNPSKTLLAGEHKLWQTLKPMIYWASNDVLSTFYAQSRKGLYRWLAKVRSERNV